MNLVIQYELSCKPVCPLGGGFRLGGFGGGHIENSAVDVVHRQERRGHSRARTQEPPTAQTQFSRGRIGELLDPLLYLALLPGLRYRIELAIRDHLRRHW